MNSMDNFSKELSMNMQTATKPLSEKIKSLSLVGAMLVAVFAAGSAHAQQAVVDLPHTIQSYIGHLLGRVEAYAQRYQDQMQYVKELQHFRQQLVSASQLIDSSMPMELPLNVEERELDYNMDKECKGPDGGTSITPSLAQLWRHVAPDLDGDVKAQQYKLCQQIVIAQNERFNEQVRMIKTISKRDEELKDIARRGQSVGSAQGKQDTNQAELSQFRARTAIDLQYSQSSLVAYDELIELMNADQQLLARQALNGKRSAAGSVVQGAALKGALQALRQRDR